MVDLNTCKKVHFVGIGGIGVSAIARMFLAEGKAVSGSDRGMTMVTDELQKLGANVYEGHAADQVPADADLVVYTIAVPADNPERARGRELGIPELSYPEVLGLISKNKFTIAVAGTHGKTTTTAMIAKIFLEAKLDPTVIVGSFLKDVQSNFIAGNSKYLIVEACEYCRSFLNLSPNILVITNIDEDHLDYYKDLEDIKSAFRELADKVSSDGVIVARAGDAVVSDTLSGVTTNIVDYDVESDVPLSLQIPGKHNQDNARAALVVARAVGIADDVAVEALESFTGTWRRFDHVGTTAGGVLVYDDYAHHPHEIQATLAGAREKWPDKKITVIFQPHLYSRTKLLLADFAQSFSNADQVIVVPIYAAREPADPAIDHHILGEAIRNAGHTNVQVYNSLSEAENEAQKLVGPENVVMTMGAGNVVEVANNMVQ